MLLRWGHPGYFYIYPFFPSLSFSFGVGVTDSGAEGIPNIRYKARTHSLCRLEFFIAPSLQPETKSLLLKPLVFFRGTFKVFPFFNLSEWERSRLIETVPIWLLFFLSRDPGLSLGDSSSLVSYFFTIRMSTYRKFKNKKSFNNKC
jgi:hypothetical protein